MVWSLWGTGVDPKSVVLYLNLASNLSLPEQNARVDVAPNFDVSYDKMIIQYHPVIKHGWLENGACIGDFSIKTPIYRGFSC